MISAAKGAAVFLDRDGTLIREVNYLRQVEQIEVLPGVAPALRLLREHGFKLVMVTNQSVVGRGQLTELGLQEIHAVLVERLAHEGATMDAIYYCPHHPTEATGSYRIACDCRKPKTGMIDRAARELGLDPSMSYMIGDQPIDLELARRVGATGILIGSVDLIPDIEAFDGPVFASLWQAAQWIVERTPHLTHTAEES
jgi:D-glycero-D-manno-heptose 1,7-bisphosphate phosphatase